MISFFSRILLQKRKDNNNAERLKWTRDSRQIHQCFKRNMEFNS